MFPFWIDLRRLSAFLSYLPSCSTTYLVLHRSFLPIISSSWDYKTSIEQISDRHVCMSPDWVLGSTLRSVCTKSLGTIRWVSDSMNLSFFWGVCRWVADSIICPLKKKSSTIVLKRNCSSQKFWQKMEPVIQILCKTFFGQIRQLLFLQKFPFCTQGWKLKPLVGHQIQVHKFCLNFNIWLVRYKWLQITVMKSMLICES